MKMGDIKLDNLSYGSYMATRPFREVCNLAVGAGAGVAGGVVGLAAGDCACSR
jgi:hypothetical protein